MNRTVRANKVWTNGVYLYVEVDLGTPLVSAWTTVCYRLASLDEAESLRLSFALERQRTRPEPPDEQDTLPWD